jgi:hypothetical protein
MNENVRITMLFGRLADIVTAMSADRRSDKPEIPAYREPWRHVLMLIGIAALLMLLCFLIFGALERIF